MEDKEQEVGFPTHCLEILGDVSEELIDKESNMAIRICHYVHIIDIHTEI